MEKIVSYRVHEMDCAEETAVLRREVGGRPGVLGTQFDVLRGRMDVRYDPARTGPEQIVAAIRGTGMSCAPWSAIPRTDTVRLWVRHGRSIMAATSGTLLAAGFLVHWALHGSLADAFAGGHEKEYAFPLAAIVLYVASAVAGAWFVAPKALLAARRARPDMNLLMVLAVVGAMAIQEWFEAATVAFLFAVALMLEHWSVERARRAVSALLDLTPTQARFVDPISAEVRQTGAEAVPVGAIVLVRPGEKIPLDGVVTEGSSSVNQAAITGESIPVPKEPGDDVFAGTINGDGAFGFRSTRPATDTTMARIIHLVQEAQSRRAPAQQWVDRFARYYTPAMLVLAIALAAIPPLLGVGSWPDWLYRGLVILVIACPCALVIATPVSVVSALTAAARSGVLVKGGAYMETVGRLRVIALDKTGTLTQGHPQVQRVVPLNGHTERELLERAAALEARSEHPLARAILRKAVAMGIQVPPADAYRAVRGKGGEGLIGGRRFWIGSHRMMHDKGQETPEVHEHAEALEDAGHTIVAVGNDEHVCGLISVADSVRESAPEAVRRLRTAGIGKVVMLTGDNATTAQAIARQTDVDEYHAELLPEDKVRVIQALVARHGQVAMIGDGINDAPALAAATVGIAMGGMGTDAAIETADIALMSDDLLKVSWLIRQSRRMLRIVQTNIAFALGLKFLFILLAVLGLASLWMAILADTGATLLVVFNGLRLLRSADRPPRIVNADVFG